MLVYACVAPEQKTVWLKQQNKSNILQKAKKFPTFGFSDAQFDKWLHKATSALGEHLNSIYSFDILYSS